MAEPPMPDLSHLSAEERQIIEEVFQRQRAEEEKETQLSQKADQELEAIEKQISKRKEIAQRLVGTQDDAICQICQKTKFADGIGHKCFYCQLRSCARCGGRVASRNKPIWACSLCQQRQRILAKTGKWFQQAATTDEAKGTISPADISPTYSAPRTPIATSGSRKSSTVVSRTTNGSHSTAASPGSSIQPTPTSITSDSDSKQSTPVQQERSQPTRKPVNPSSIKRQPTLLRQPSLETERRNDKARPATAVTHDNLKQHDVEQCPANRSVSVESFEQIAPSESQQQMNLIRHTNDRLTQNKSNVEDGHAKSGRKRVENLQQQQPSDEQTRKRISNGIVDEKQPRGDTSFQANKRYQFRSNVVSRDEYKQKENAGQRKDLEVGMQPKKNTSSSVVVSMSSCGGAELRRSRTVRESDSKRLPASTISEQQVHPLPPATSSIFSSGRRKMKLPRQLHSMSSSEDELPSTSSGNNEGVLSIETEISSEKDILRYIYGSQKVPSGRKFSSGSNRKFQRDNEMMNVPVVQSTVLPGDVLAAKIRTYLSHPVTWQPSADQHRLIGHMILHKSNGTRGDLGLKVVGGRRSDTGRLGAFITQVKPGSVADVVGRLRRGDEVLEWNGRQLQNATYDQVYDTINLSRNDAQVELIVSRSLSAPGGDDFLNVQRMLPNPAFLPSGGSGIGDYYLSNSLESSGFSHLQSGITSPHTQPFINAPSNYHPSLICKATADSSVYDTAGSSRVIACDDYCRREFGRGQIFGGIEISLYYGAVERQLVVTVRHAIDLPPRPDGAARNPYVKLFLLPDRSEKSRRQSAVLVETCNPIWNEPFYYHGLTKAMLMERVLEVTVWDYDQYEANSFMGEVLIDFTIAQLDDEPFLYTLVDMHEDNPLRAKIQQRRLNIYHASPRSQNEAGGPYMNIHQKGVTNYTTTYEAYQPVSRQQRMTHSNYGIRQSRTCDRSGTRTNEDWVAIYPSGYLSDHGYSNEMPMRYSHRERRPRSATAMRPLSDMQTNNRNLPPAPWVADEDDGQQMAVAVPNSTHAQTRFPRDPRSPGERLRLEAMHEQQPGYGSDGSETISIHSAQSVPARQSMRHITNGESEQVSMNQQMDDNVEEYIEEGAISDSMIAKGGIATATKDRKKSLMTRLIPGRNAPLEGKRTGFQRSEEVGIPEGLTVPGETPFMQQTSKESTDSSHSDNWGPILTDGPLGSFVESLGPGQVVGRQVLASPVLGEIQIGIATDRAGIDVEIIRAKNLVVKPGVKVNPAPYVKVYLLEGKQCIAKAKTRAIRRTTTPVFQQHIVFSETPRRKMLQITVMADYGRMERKSFMGIAQIRLDDLELSAEPMVGWYKLYHSSSLAGTGPVHKDSDTSFEIKQ